MWQKTDIVYITMWLKIDIIYYYHVTQTDIKFVKYLCVKLLNICVWNLRWHVLYCFWMIQEFQPLSETSWYIWYLYILPQGILLLQLQLYHTYCKLYKWSPRIQRSRTAKCLKLDNTYSCPSFIGTFPWKHKILYTAGGPWLRQSSAGTTRAPLFDSQLGKVCFSPVCYTCVFSFIVKIISQVSWNENWLTTDVVAD